MLFSLEWKLLKEFEKKDLLLNEKMGAKKKEKYDIVTKIQECVQKVHQKKEELEDLVTAEKSLFSQFRELLGEGSKYEEYLTKVFTRKIKRVKVNLMIC
jgi:hypothetical protein